MAEFSGREFYELEEVAKGMIVWKSRGDGVTRVNQLSNIESEILQADRQSCFARTGMSFEFFVKVL